MFRPSTNASTDTSGPTSISSMTTRPPASPCTFFRIAAAIASSASRQRVFGADDDEADAVVAGEPLDLVELHDADRDVVGDLLRAGVAGGDVQAGDAGG